MNLENLIVQRRTIHQFLNEKVSDELVLKALEMGIHAPNHHLTFPWRFLLVGPKSRLELANLSVEIKQEKSTNPLSPVMVEAIKKKVLLPSHLIVLVIPKSNSVVQQQEDYASMACAVQNISLFLWSQKIGTKWSSGKLTEHEKTYNLLNLKKSENKIVGFLWVGRADVVPNKPIRPKINELVQFLD